jgi:CheY-like chemotaxis protein
MIALIIEDDDVKMDRLRGFLAHEAPAVQIEVARSYKSGLLALVALQPALVLLDMTLPSFDIQPGSDGGRPLSLGGKDLLRQMKRRDIRCSAIVVTGFDTFGSNPTPVTLEQLDGQLANEFGDVYLGSVYFNAATEDWRDRLRALLRNLTQLETDA